MSRRRGDGKASPLDQAYAEHGLMRRGQVAHHLGVGTEVVHRLMKGGALPVESFDYKGALAYGVPIEAVDAVAMRMGGAPSR